MKIQETIFQERASDKIMSIDMSTRSTGIVLLSVDKTPIMSIRLQRERQEEPMQYKVALKNYLHNLLLADTSILSVVQEEPIPSSTKSAELLYSMRTAVKELQYEDTSSLNFTYCERGNSTWKSAFLKPIKLPYPRNSRKEKELVYNKVIGMYKNFIGLSYDETDAFG